MPDPASKSEGRGLLSDRVHELAISRGKGRTRTRQCRMATPWGTAAEEGARRLAADLGVPDFVYDPVQIAKGQSTREVSDGMLIAGDRGLIIQTKAREPGSDGSRKAVTKWITGSAAKATSQIKGTRRTLMNNDITVRSRRGHERHLKAGHEWPGVVLLSLEDVPDDIVVETEPNSIVMTLDDWHALHDMVLSTTAIITYVDRVIEAGIEWHLGDEEARYREFAAADLATFGSPTSYPTLPLQRVAGLDRTHAEVLDQWINEDIALTPVGDGDTETSPEFVRRAVEILDAIPILGRLNLGRLLVERARQSDESGEPRSGLVAPMGDGAVGTVLFFSDVEANWPDHELFERYCAAYAAVRHEQLPAIVGDRPTLLLARLSLDNGTATRTFVFVEGQDSESAIPPEIRWSILDRHGTLTAKGARPVANVTRRNDPLPVLVRQEVQDLSRSSIDEATDQISKIDPQTRQWMLFRSLGTLTGSKG